VGPLKGRETDFEFVGLSAKLSRVDGQEAFADC